MMTNDDERGEGGVKNAQNLMTLYVNDPLVPSMYSGNVYQITKRPSVHRTCVL